jgi:hypothetical protein
MSDKSKIPVRDLTPMFRQIPSTDKEHSRSRKDKDKLTSFSANFSASERSRSASDRHQTRANDKIKDLRNLVRNENLLGNLRSDLFPSISRK